MMQFTNINREAAIMATTYKVASIAFEEAISKRRLSACPSADNYAGHYMYMFTSNGVDAFKHIETRQYLREE
jgi:hypothetical protein